RGKRLRAVRGASRADHRQIADRELPNAMCARQQRIWHFTFDRVDDPANLLFGHRNVSLVFEFRDVIALVRVAYAPNEQHDSSLGVTAHGLVRFVDAERRAANRGQGHEAPPLSKSPVRPPRFSSSWVGPITIARSTPLSIS